MTGRCPPSTLRRATILDLPEEFALVRQKVHVSESRAQATALDGDALFRRYAEFVASFLSRLGVPDADFEDLVQDVFMTAHRRGGYRPGPASPTTFLARIALEARLANHRRHARGTQVHADLLLRNTTGDPADTPEQLATMNQAARALQWTLDGMDEGLRAVFVLFELEGESGKSIAAGLGIQLGTVYSRLHEARRRFAERVEQLP